MYLQSASLFWDKLLTLSHLWIIIVERPTFAGDWLPCCKTGAGLQCEDRLSGGYFRHRAILLDNQHIVQCEGWLSCGRATLSQTGQPDLRDPDGQKIWFIVLVSETLQVVLKITRKVPEPTKFRWRGWKWGCADSKDLASKPNQSWHWHSPLQRPAYSF